MVQTLKNERKKKFQNNYNWEKFETTDLLSHKREAKNLACVSIAIRRGTTNLMIVRLLKKYQAAG